jgi:hypothetical protein
VITREASVPIVVSKPNLPYILISEHVIASNLRPAVWGLAENP